MIFIIINSLIDLWVSRFLNSLKMRAQTGEREGEREREMLNNHSYRIFNVRALILSFDISSHDMIIEEGFPFKKI